MFDETYSNDKHYYYYACTVRLNDDMTDFEIAENQTITLQRDAYGNFKMSDPNIAVGICYVYDPVTNDQPTGTGYDGCQLKWFGIAYADMEWVPVDTFTTIPEGVEKNKYALCHNSGGRFIEMAINKDKVYIAGMAADPKACFVGEIAADGQSVVFHTNQFLGVDESEEYFHYMVAAAPEDIENPDTGQITHTIAPTDSFTAILDSDKKTLSFMEHETGFAISNGPEKVGGGTLYIEPLITRQDDYVIDTPSDPEIVAYNPYNEANGYGTFNFNLPFWNKQGLLLNPDNMFYNVYLDDEVMTFSADIYTSLDNDITNLPYYFSDYYDIFSVGINHAVYLYEGGYKRIGVQSFVMADGIEYRSPIIYNISDDVGIDNIPERSNNVIDTYYLDFSGKRIENPTGFAIKCTRYDDGRMKSEKFIGRGTASVRN